MSENAVSSEFDHLLQPFNTRFKGNLNTHLFPNKKALTRYRYIGGMMVQGENHWRVKVRSKEKLKLLKI